MERISIIIPTYNQAPFLSDAIESALTQTRPADEIILVDNGSTDTTPDIAARYPVRYVRQANEGLCGSANRGILEATGDYLAILHSDDRLLPHHLERNMTAFRERPDAAFVCGDYRWFGADEAWHVHQCHPRPDYYGALLRLNFIGPPIVVLFKREILLRLGGFRREFEGADDQELYLRIARSYPIHCHHEVIAEYRRHVGQESQNVSKMLAASIRMLRAQRAYVHQHPEYLAAYRDGLRHRRALYGQMIFWEAIREAKAHHWARSAQCLSLLVQYDRRDLMRPFYRKILRLWRRTAPTPVGSTGRPALH